MLDFQDMTAAEIVDVAWDMLDRAARERSGPAHLLALATASAEGPSVRTVVLRDADRSASRITIWTNRLSAKMTDITEEPRAEAMVWDSGTGLQIRLKLRLTPRAGPSDVWDKLPPDARLNYIGPPAPGSTIDDPDTASKLPTSQDNFCALDGTVQALDVLILTDTLHRRVQCDAHGTRWVVP